VLVGIGCVSPAFAQDEEAPEEEAYDEEARMLFEAGRRAFDDGRFEEALGHFQRAYELSGRPQLLFNVASAFDRLGRKREGAEWYGRYLEEAPDAPNRNFAERRIEILEREADEDERAAAEAAAAAAAAAAAQEERSLVGPIALLAGGGAAAVTALATGLVANKIYADLESQCPEGFCDDSLRDDADRMDRLAIVTDVLLVVAVGALTGGVLWWVLGGGEDEPTTEASCGLGGCELRVSF